MGLLGVIWKRRPQACLPEMVRILKKVPVWMTERVKIAEMFLSSWIYNRELILIQRQNNKALAIPSPKVALGILPLQKTACRERLAPGFCWPASHPVTVGSSAGPGCGFSWQRPRESALGRVTSPLTSLAHWLLGEGFHLVAFSFSFHAVMEIHC